MHSVALKIFLLVEVGNKKQEVTKKENIQKGVLYTDTDGFYLSQYRNQ